MNRTSQWVDNDTCRCGGDRVGIQIGDVGTITSGLLRVSCCSCYRVGPWAKETEEAVQKWNRYLQATKRQEVNDG